VGQFISFRENRGRDPFSQKGDEMKNKGSILRSVGVTEDHRRERRHLGTNNNEQKERRKEREGRKKGPGLLKGEEQHWKGGDINRIITKWRKNQLCSDAKLTGENSGTTIENI